VRGGRALAGSAILAALVAPQVSARKIDVGGHRLYYEARGKGDALVVFDAGLGETHEAWRWVWPEVAKFARVVLYDRAGLGRSDLGPAPRTSARIGEELHSLLIRAGLPGPYILVGHSLGGLNVQWFASRYPLEVAAVVLVEPTPVDFPSREAELLSEYARAKFATTLGASGEGVRLEHASVEASAEQVRVARPFPNIPVVLLTSPRAEESSEFRRAWDEMQRSLALELDAELHLVASGSGHYIQFDAPHMIVEAIRDAVREAGLTPAGKP
jgi:pimeloyl-ACP methyl ester carboxylesterase